MKILNRNLCKLFQVLYNICIENFHRGTKNIKLDLKGKIKNFDEDCETKQIIYMKKYQHEKILRGLYCFHRNATEEFSYLTLVSSTIDFHNAMESFQTSFILCCSTGPLTTVERK